MLFDGLFKVYLFKLMSELLSFLGLLLIIELLKLFFLMLLTIWSGSDFTSSLIMFNKQFSLDFQFFFNCFIFFSEFSIVFILFYFYMTLFSSSLFFFKLTLHFRTVSIHYFSKTMNSYFSAYIVSETRQYELSLILN
jgi:hypothetical protein